MLNALNLLGSLAIGLCLYACAGPSGWFGGLFVSEGDGDISNGGGDRAYNTDEKRIGAFGGLTGGFNAGDCKRCGSVVQLLLAERDAATAAHAEAEAAREELAAGNALLDAWRAEAAAHACPDPCPAPGAHETPPGDAGGDDEPITPVAASILTIASAGILEALRRFGLMGQRAKDL